MYDDPENPSYHRRHKVPPGCAAGEDAPDTYCRFWDLTRNTSDLIYTLDLQGRITSANQACERVSGYTREELVGMDISSLIASPEQESLSRERIERKVSGRELASVYELECRSKSGRPVILEINSHLNFRNGRPYEIFGIARDVTFRREMERALAESEDRFRNLVAEFPVVVVIHADNRIEYINDAVKELLGYTVEEMMNGPVLVHIHEEDRPMVVDKIMRRLRGEDVPEYVTRFRRKDGTVVHGQVRGVITKYKNRPMILTVLHNVEERLRFEAELKRANEQLEERVEERTAALRRANQKLLELDQVKTDFLSTVSHELRTPLTSIVGFAKIMRKRFREVLLPLIPDEDDRISRLVGQMRENFDVIISEGDRLTALINDLLDLSKMEAGRIEWKREPLDAAVLVRKAAASIEPLCRQRGLDLSTEVPPDPVPLVGDTDRLHQVILNLVSNAVKFTETGCVTVGCRRHPDHVRFSVMDTGPGIPEEHRLRIFEKFTQLETSRGPRAKGTGLGLAICRQIVEAHGGAIWVESTPAGGSNFLFTLPV